MELHQHVRKLLPEVKEWCVGTQERDDYATELKLFEASWPVRPLPRRALGPFRRMIRCFEGNAMLALAEGNPATLAGSFRNAMGFASLALRWHVFVPMPNPEGNIPLSAWGTVRSTGPAILSQWDMARTCAEAIITAAHLNQLHYSSESRAQSWGRGTVDALLVYLYAAAFDLPTHYETVVPLVPAYRELLENWRTSDQAVYRHVMQQAADFHLECCGKGDDDKTYEFEAYATQIFPFELLVVQALRRREGLADFDTGHTLIDAPWTLLRALPPAPPDPLLARCEERLRADYPEFR